MSVIDKTEEEQKINLDWFYRSNINIDVIDKIEEKYEINLDWFYHSTPYNKENITSILTEGIKCAELLGDDGNSCNGPYYISLSKAAITDSESFARYVMHRPTFIIEGIEPIKCVSRPDYYKYIDTKDPRRNGLGGEYQYYYFIKNTYIKGIVYSLSRFLVGRYPSQQQVLLNLLELISLLEQLNIDIPIYDYSRKNKTLVHKIDKEQLKYYQKEIII